MKEKNLGKRDKVATDLLIIPIGCDPFGKQKTKSRTSEELVSSSTLEEEKGEKIYELLIEKAVKDYKCTNQST